MYLALVYTSLRRIPVVGAPWLSSCHRRLRPSSDRFNTKRTYRYRHSKDGRRRFMVYEAVLCWLHGLWSSFTSDNNTPSPLSAVVIEPVGY